MILYVKYKLFVQWATCDKISDQFGFHVEQGLIASLIWIQIKFTWKLTYQYRCHYILFSSLDSAIFLKKIGSEMHRVTQNLVREGEMLIISMPG
jgi:hypothetical protein